MDPVLKHVLNSPRGGFVQKFSFASMLKVSNTFFKPNTDCQVLKSQESLKNIYSPKE